ncbi:uncharacterized protein LOC136083747 isoform X2 [Hydra vulgaris]
MCDSYVQSNNECKEIIQHKCKRGERGPKGDVGPQGPKGDQGEKGFSLIEPQSELIDLDKTVLVAENNTLVCKFFGNPIPSVEWIINGTNYEVKTKVYESLSVVISYLTVSNISFQNHGNVSCIGKSILGQVEKTGFFNVHIKPSVSFSSSLIYVYLASNATFPICNVITNPTAKIVWKKGFGELPATRSIQSGFGDFMIMDVQVEDEGFYVCLAENYLGSASGMLQLKTKPLEITYGPPAESVVFGFPITLWCGSFGRTDKMSGNWRSLITGEAIEHTEIKNKSFFNITIQVINSGIYSCEFTDGISTVDRVSVIRSFILTSNIITTIEANKKFYDWLKKINIPTYKISRCMQVSRVFKFDSNTIWKLFEPCYSIKNSLLVVKMVGAESWILGGFTDTPWSNVRDMARDSASDKTFVFTTYPDNILKIKDLGNKQICSKTLRYGRIYPCFGTEQVVFEEQYERLNMNDYSLKVRSFLLLGSDMPIKVQDMEVFYFT